MTFLQNPDSYLPLLTNLLACLKYVSTTISDKFDNEFYSFPDGLPMGLPLASLVAEIFMDSLERNIFTSNNPLFSSIHYWYRYVDDVLYLWTGPSELLQNLLAFIHSFHPNLKFTIEIGGQQINFSDLTISLKEDRHYLFSDFS